MKFKKRNIQVVDHSTGQTLDFPTFGKVAGEEAITELEKNVDNKIADLKSMVGTPLKASTASAMNDSEKIYVYTGSESGYTNGHWYYNDDGAWVDGGVYNSTAVETDKTLSIENMPADAKKTGDEVNAIKNTLTALATRQTVATTKKEGFYVSDGQYVASDATSCIYVVDLTKIGEETALDLTISGSSNRCRFLYTATLANDVTIGTSGTYVDNGNDTKSVSIPYSTWSLYNTLCICTNYRTDEPYASVEVKGTSVTLNTNVIDSGSITDDKCSFFKRCEQMLRTADATNDTFWNISSGKASTSSGSGQKSFARIKLTKGITYRFVDVYGYFCIITDADGNNAVRLTDVVTTQWSGYYTPSADCYIYMTVKDSYFGTTAMLLNDATYLPNAYTEGEYYTYFIGNIPNKQVDIHVKKDGTGDYTSVVDAVNFANSQKGNYTINIYVHTGDYDILEELGGDDFLETVLDSVDERQGLVLKADNINLIGVGLVTLRYELADDVDYYQSSRTSCLNLREFSNKVENLTLIAKNCRYTIHDETNGGNPYIHRVMKNLRCIHKGNASGLWAYPTVMGGGAGGGSTYDVINCQFITSSYHRAFSYHSGANQEASMFNIDGCIGSVKGDAPTKVSFRLSYHGTGRTGVSVGNIKNCSGNGQAIVEPEVSGDTDNNIEMYVNGWETIEPITLTGNE